MISRPMKFFPFCICLGLLAASCSRQKPDTAAWSPPQPVAKSSDSLTTSFTLYRWNGSLLTLGGDDGSSAVRVFEQESNGWRTLSTGDLARLPSAVDPHGRSLVAAGATALRHSVDSEFTVGTLEADGRVKSAGSFSLSLRQETLFPKAPSNLEINESDRSVEVPFFGGMMDGLAVRVPYSLTGTPIERKGLQVGIRADLSESANGVFASSDGGRTWRNEPIPHRWSASLAVCRTKAFYYYFAVSGLGGIEPCELWYSRCPVENSSWSPAETLNHSVARRLGHGVCPIVEGDTLHLCWLDARHERTRPSLSRPYDANYEVAYCRRKDSDNAWSKDIILSKGLGWAYAPSMSGEGDKLVVAWAGAKTGALDRNEWNPSDIYFATSRDGGKTWTKPGQVTDSFKNGITSGKPQVALCQGVIHLFYVQGKLNYQEVSSGMAKLNQPPWPVLYQQRPFPD